MLLSSGVNDRSKNYSGKDAYILSKVQFVEEIAKNGIRLVKSDWYIVESGTVGPDFYIPNLKQAFTAVAVAGPNGYLKSKIFYSTSTQREENMWEFTKEAL